VIAWTRRDVVQLLFFAGLVGCARAAPPPSSTRTKVASGAPARAAALRRLVPEVEIDDDDMDRFVRDFSAALAARPKIPGAPQPTADEIDGMWIDSYLLSTDYFAVLKRGEKKVRYVRLHRQGEHCQHL